MGRSTRAVGKRPSRTTAALLASALSCGLMACATHAQPTVEPAIEPQPEGARYDLHGGRDLTVGDGYRWSHNEYERTTLAWGAGEDEVVESDTYLRYGITANSMVTAVDETNHVVAVTHIIERLYLMEDELLPPGTVLVATFDGDQTVYTVGDDRVGNEIVLYVLERVAGLGDPEKDFETHLRVPETPQPVGARWEIDGPSFFSEVLETDEPLDPALASGEVHFVRVEEVFGTPGVVLEVALLFEGVTQALDEVEPDWELRRSTIQVDGTLIGPQPQEALEVRMEMSRRISQAWYDPALEREGTSTRYTELSMGRRELTAHEQTLLGFEE